MARFLIRDLLRLRSGSRFSFSSLSSAPRPRNPCNLIDECRNVKQLFQIHAHLIVSNRVRNEFIVSKMMKKGLDFGLTDYTLLIFNQIEWLGFPDTVCVNTAIKACSLGDKERGVKGVGLYFRMKDCGFWPNSYTFVPLIGCCVKADSFELGGICYGQAVKNGVDFVVPVRNALVYMYGCFGMVDVAKQAFDEMCERDVVSWNSMMEGYLRVGDMAGARKVFDEMLERNDVSWNVMIGGYLKGGSPGKGLKLFREMMGGDVRWSDTTMVLVVTACGRSARLREGRSVHARSVKSLQKWSLLVDTCLIDMYSKCGRVDKARLVFDRMFKRNLVSWNAMIVGHCIHGEPEDGISLFNEMMNSVTPGAGGESFIVQQTLEVRPNETTYIAILCASARLGLLEEGRRHFADMIDRWNIKPNFAHYWCMANIFVSAGLRVEAADSMRNMPEILHDLSSQSLAWASLLAACRFKGDTSEAERVGYSLIDAEPENSLCYILLLNIYAAAERWEDVVRIQDVIKQRKIAIPHGCSLFDLKTVVHDLKVADKVLASVELNSFTSERCEFKAMS